MIRIMLRGKSPAFILVLLVTLGLLAVLIGCRSTEHAIIGSGNLTTKEMGVSDFTKLEIGHVFQAKVTRSDSFSVSITADDNLFEYIVVRKSGNTLRIYLEAGCSYIGTTKIVEITMPEIDKLSLSGASRGEVSGFRSSDSIKLEASGASYLYIDNLKAGDTNFEISGASHVSGSIEIDDGEFNISNASSLDLEGFAHDVSIKVSEASHANLANFPVSNAIVDISGVSIATVKTSGNINGNINDASRLTYIGSPTLTIETSGGSTIDYK